MTETVTIEVEIDAQELWSGVLGSAYESFEWWLGEKYVGDADWETPGQVIITYEDPDTNEAKRKTLDVNDFARAYQMALKNKNYHCGSYKIDIEDPDACVGDIVMQYAIFGEIIYG